MSRYSVGAELDRDAAAKKRNSPEKRGEKRGHCALDVLYVLVLVRVRVCMRVRVCAYANVPTSWIQRVELARSHTRENIKQVSRSSGSREKLVFV